MLTRFRLTAAIATIAIATAACAGSSASPSGGTVAPTVTPSPTATQQATQLAPSASLKDVADAYLAFVTGWNAKSGAVYDQYGDGGSDPATLKAMWTAYAELGDEFVTGIDAMAWPTELRPTADRLAEANAAIAAVSRELATDPTSADLMSKYEAAAAAQRPIAQELRAKLGLPSLPTPEPAASPSPTPAPTPSPAPTPRASA